MVPVLKKLKVWTLYVHIVAQVNHMGLGVKVETNCLRDSDQIPRHSFLSTTFSIFINGVLKCMCVFACSLVADKTSLRSELSKCKQSKSILKVMTLVMPWLRDIRGGINKFIKSYTFSVFCTFINMKPLYTLGICTEQICVIWHQTNTVS